MKSYRLQLGSYLGAIQSQDVRPEGTPPPLPEIDSLKPGELIAADRYRLSRRLRTGGNGEVWLAAHTAMAADVVVKFPRRWNAACLTRDDQLKREVASLVAFSNRHPHIVNILDVGEHVGRRFIVTQFMRNGSLHEFRNGSEMSVEGLVAKLAQRLSWLLEIADALDFIHAAGLIHRDVKPSNVLLDDSYSAYLADFGIAIAESLDGITLKLADEQRGCVVGSLPYLSTELLRGTPASPASDQFALAVTLYEFALGNTPFACKSAKELLEAQHSLISRWTADAAIPGFSPAFSNVLIRGLALDPERRYPTCSEFAYDAVSAWQPLSLPLAKKSRSTAGAAIPNRTPSDRTIPIGHETTSTKTKPPLPIINVPVEATKKLRINRLLKERPSESVETEES